ncbi:MAG: type II toxin-antitoxin system RelB/DinJ family antitoxin [Clostridiales bacterium]|nr:type II toxin-antitoxin system RelB/DinJ family antitoxin [Clostridiales bacterium]
MQKQALIQVRVDESLKREVSEIYEKLGIDLPTAIRMFLARSKMVRGVPFDTTLPENVVTKSEAMNAFEELRKQAEHLPEMTMDEIDVEISESRKLRREGKNAVSGSI